MGKNEQNFLIMVKILELQQKTDVPERDRDHFYKHFGELINKMLQSKEHYIFFSLLTAFIQWASNTEL